MTDYITAVKAFVLDEFLPDVPADQLDEHDDLLDGGVIDSLGVLKVLAWLEDEFDMPVDEIDFALENFRTVAAISAFIGGPREVADVNHP